MAVTIYHNPRCTKSRAALGLLRDNGVEPVVVEYLKNPPTARELDATLKLLGLEPRDVMRTQEESFRKLGLGDRGLSRKALIAAMVENPILIERPIAVSDGMAVIGRPPEAVLSLLAANKGKSRSKGQPARSH